MAGCSASCIRSKGPGSIQRRTTCGRSSTPCPSPVRRPRRASRKRQGNRLTTPAWRHARPATRSSASGKTATNSTLPIRSTVPGPAHSARRLGHRPLSRRRQAAPSAALLPHHEPGRPAVRARAGRATLQGERLAHGHAVEPRHVALVPTPGSAPPPRTSPRQCAPTRSSRTCASRAPRRSIPPGSSSPTSGL